MIFVVIENHLNVSSHHRNKIELKSKSRKKTKTTALMILNKIDKIIIQKTKEKENTKKFLGRYK